MTLWSKVGAQPAFFIAEIGSAAPLGAYLGRGGRPNSPRAGVAVAGDEDIRQTVEQYVIDTGLELDYLQVSGRGAPTIRVVVDDDGGVGMDRLAAVSRGLSHRLDQLDPYTGPYSLEVTTPGLERPLHLPRHYRKSIGRDLTVKTQVEVAGSRHHRGVLESADAHGFTLRIDGMARRLEYTQVSSARTLFEWGKKSQTTRKSR